MPVSLFVCPYCKAATRLDRTSFEKPVWCCSGGCKARVGCHPNTIRPLGTVAKQDLRRMREGCHILFDRLWRNTEAPYWVGDRDAAYRWLAKQMDVPHEAAHIGMFNEEQCERLLGILQSIVHPGIQVPDGWVQS